MTDTKKQYYVVGGLYKDTSFTNIADGEKLWKFGPFDNYEEAVAVWRAKAMETIDEAYAKFNIEILEPTEYWVVGGEYTDTNFKELKGGVQEEHIGPFNNRDDARSAWKSKSMEHIDNAYVRYRIEKL
ncbi:DUF4170 domain-containing protein [Aestuariispira ectoiniformans]|uniref:DUF4170 domain-containing protein n=1 Tax=Aestuariispira ectoiniformans TaxID=2775080 RepID=UPI00223AF35C|nr:DUF4170 domain-containing protein [Aestuariispira ectoiniformans]